MTATPEQPKKRSTAVVIELDDSPVKQKSKKTEAEKTYPSPENTDIRRSSQNEVVMFDDDEHVGASPKGSSSDVEREPAPSAPSEVKGASGFKMSGVTIAKPVVQRKEESTRPFRDPRAQDVLPGKRKMLSDAELAGYSSDEELMRDAKSRRKINLHTGYGKVKRPTFGARSITVPRSSQQSQYGKEAIRKQKIAEKQFKRAEAAAVKQKAQNSPKKKFKMSDAFEFGSTASSQATSAVQTSFTSAGAELEAPEIDESPLTESSEDEIEATEICEGVPTVKCEHCGEALKRSLLEDFQDEVLRGRELNYKWQRRFCRWHQQQKAEAQWRERGYPEIDWKQLSRRMRAHDSFLKDIVNDTVESHYRDELKSKSKKSRKDLEHVITGHESRGGASMGYYGPKGAKLITEHIIGRLTNDIRQRSKKDKLVSTSGVQGGVSGFVQVVLAPHLVELLVKEDMKLAGDDWESRAREIIAESTHLGELLHPEEEDDKVDDVDTAHVIAMVEDDSD
ncbi:uncharacterized protein MYCFIDRAFT_216364 [Pseudocercospora fijiensis CIRAD86]|uniref:Restriction of telomere capping protein 4 n=1 Tax=Pseudocercospora fijiensis (strain CIRAD86) TaxID=383855 RepID=M3A3I2_PSEFD|nr:uncharacterized protein MYCFIDRAFT_216364 [Pseudocercospora fijiensis CIRAD86]EME79196.1 hypothetical protein MYCFIDRAFT_216364 [Pseudocercospora fijiensis CIRAD86]